MKVMDEETDDTGESMCETEKGAASKLDTREEEEDMESEGGEKSNKLFNDSEEMSGEKDSSVGDKATSRKVEENDMVTLHEDSSQKVYNDVEEGKGPSPVKSCKPLDLYHNVSTIAYCYKRVHLNKVRS